MLSLGMLQKTGGRRREAERGLNLVVINSYRVDPSNGRPLLDADNKPIPADTVANPYAPGDEDESRGLVKARKLQYEDWITLLIFNHLFSGADAFVAAQLWDLPQRVEFRRLPGGSHALLFRIPFR
jgi:hypothetical protein